MISLFSNGPVAFSKTRPRRHESMKPTNRVYLLLSPRARSSTVHNIMKLLYLVSAASAVLLTKAAPFQSAVVLPSALRQIVEIPDYAIYCKTNVDCTSQQFMRLLFMILTLSLQKVATHVNVSRFQWDNKANSRKTYVSISSKETESHKNV